MLNFEHKEGIGTNLPFYNDLCLVHFYLPPVFVKEMLGPEEIKLPKFHKHNKHLCLVCETDYYTCSQLGGALPLPYHRVIVKLRVLPSCGHTLSRV